MTTFLLLRACGGSRAGLGAELIDNGYAGTTVERIARRAGIAKTTIYRRWGGLDGLLADLMAEHAEQEIPVPDHGNLDADLRALAREVVTSLASPAIRAAFATIVAAAVQNPAARELLSRFLDARTAKMNVIVAPRRAARRAAARTSTLGVRIPMRCPAYCRRWQR